MRKNLISSLIRVFDVIKLSIIMISDRKISLRVKILLIEKMSRTILKLFLLCMPIPLAMCNIVWYSKKTALSYFKREMQKNIGVKYWRQALHARFCGTVTLSLDC